MLVTTETFLIKRDAGTQIPVSAPSHEAVILESIHGKENLYPQGVTGECEIDETAEYQRLCNKFGEQVVGEVFGGSPDRAIKQAMQEHEIDSNKAAEAAAKAEAKAAKTAAKSAQSAQSE